MVFTAVQFMIARAWKQPEEWIEKTCEYTTGCYSAVKGTQPVTYRAGGEQSRTRPKGRSSSGCAWRLSQSEIGKRETNVVYWNTYVESRKMA